MANGQCCGGKNGCASGHCSSGEQKSENKKSCAGCKGCGILGVSVFVVMLLALAFVGNSIMAKQESVDPTAGERIVPVAHVEVAPLK